MLLLSFICLILFLNTFAALKSNGDGVTYIPVGNGAAQISSLEILCSSNCTFQTQMQSSCCRAQEELFCFSKVVFQQEFLLDDWLWAVMKWPLCQTFWEWQEKKGPRRNAQCFCLSARYYFHSHNNKDCTETSTKQSPSLSFQHRCSPGRRVKNTKFNCLNQEGLQFQK